MRRFLTVILVVCASVFSLAPSAHAADKSQSASAQKAAKASAKKARADKAKAAEKKVRAEKTIQTERRLPALQKAAPIADKPVSAAEKKPRGAMPVGQLKSEVDAQLALAQQRTSGLIATKRLAGAKAKAVRQPVETAAAQVRSTFKRAAADGVITKREAKDVQDAMRAMRAATPRLTPKK